MTNNSRLGAMMFLQYALWGAWLPVTARYLSASVSDGGLGFTGSQIGMILGLAAAYSFLDSLSVTNTGAKYENFNTFLNTSIKNYQIDKFTLNSAGPIQDILILQKFLEVYDVLAPGTGWVSIGEKTWSDWRTDTGIHGKSATKVEVTEESEEE